MWQPVIWVSGVCQHPLTALDAVPEHCCHVDMVRQSHISLWVRVLLCASRRVLATAEHGSAPATHPPPTRTERFPRSFFSVLILPFICACFPACVWTEKLLQRPPHVFNLLTAGLQFSVWYVRCSGCLGFKHYKGIFSPGLRLPLSTRKKTF